jgi:hypothetical protein
VASHSPGRYFLGIAAGRHRESSVIGKHTGAAFATPARNGAAVFRPRRATFPCKTLATLPILQCGLWSSYIHREGI